jgi:hypothetical protein
MRQLMVTAILTICVYLGSAGADNGQTTKQSPDISPEDMEIIRLMETLVLMDMAEELELVQEWEIITEEKNDEND